MLATSSGFVIDTTCMLYVFPASYTTSAGFVYTFPSLSTISYCTPVITTVALLITYPASTVVSAWSLSPFTVTSARYVPASVGAPSNAGSSSPFSPVAFLYTSFPSTVSFTAS